MLSSEGESTDTAAIGQQVPLTTEIQWEDGLEREKIFPLIEKILSFEACLYHQMLPFKIEDNNLLLGIVNSQDGAALDYVNRIMSYMNCTVTTQPISSETHRKVLSAYLNHKNTSLTVTNPTQKSSIDFTKEKKAANSANVRVELPQQSKWELTQAQVSENTTTQTHTSDTRIPLTNSVVPPQTENLIGDEETQKTSPPESASHLHILHLPESKAFIPVEELAVLPPKKLLEQLLARVLSAGGIGRLYLERQPYQGRILWSENGVLQSVLEKLPLSVFQGALNELKRFASLPMTTIVEPKQIEKECLYQQNRVLLRLRVMPGMHGEEATLQVLRGAALKFYQQQQLTRLSHDTLGISQQLSYKLHELKERLVLTQNLKSRQLEAFNALNQLLENLDYQVQVLTEISEPPKSQK